MQPYLILMSGGSASGKSSIVQLLKEDYPELITVIYFDDYYKSLTRLTLEERARVNFDHPDAFDLDLLIAHLKDLKNGIEIEKPIYDFTCHDRKEEWVKVKPSPIIILDGILSLAVEEIKKLGDLKIFVDTPADIRFIRRLERDMIERGRTLESIKKQYLETVRPMHELLVEPSKYNADLIIPIGASNKVALDVLKSKIEAKMQ